MDDVFAKREDLATEPARMTVNDLQQELDILKSSFGGSLERDAIYEDKEQERQVLLESFVSKQIEQSSRYKNIFRTEQGSVYFVLDTGESLRVRLGNGKWDLNPIFSKIVYVAVPLKRQDELYRLYKNSVMAATACQIGMTPVEFSKTSLNSEALRYHQGHPISEVIK